jgi:ABC-type Fe3+-hydroxamate transport system substrate-binding protein
MKTIVTALLAIFVLQNVAFPQESAVHDDLGRILTCPSPPQRIVSLAPSITETLFALGLDSSIVGVTDFCNYPPAAATKASVGGINNPNLEQIASLRPDLIVMSVSGNNRSDFDKLIALGMNIFVSNPRSVDGVFRSLESLGVLCGRAGSARRIVDSLRTYERKMVGKAAAFPEKSVLLLLSLRPLIAIGKGTFIDELLSLANARNVTHDTPTAYPILGREEIIRLQPDVIVVTTEVASRVSEILAEYPEWNTLAAVRNKRVAFVNADLISRPGPRIVQGLDQLVHAIHQERSP